MIIEIITHVKYYYRFYIDIWFAISWTNLHLESNEENRHHDGIAPAVIEEYGEVYGDINEEPDVHSVVNNPYYGSDTEMITSRSKTSHGNNKSSEIEVIKSTKNVYYDM